MKYDIKRGIRYSNNESNKDIVYDMKHYLDILKENIEDVWSNDLNKKERRILYDYISSEGIYYYKLMSIEAGMRKYISMGLPGNTLRNLGEQSDREVFKIVSDIDDKIIDMIRILGNTDIESLKDYIKGSNLKETEYTFEKCKECGGACCARRSCYFAPWDFKDELLASKEGIMKILKTGLVVIDRYDADSHYTKNVYMLRPKMICDGDRIVNYAFTSHCLLLGEHGCELPFNKRPYAGASLQTGKNPGEDCHYPVKEMNKNSNLYMAKLWDRRKLQRNLEEIAKENEAVDGSYENVMITALNGLMPDLSAIYDLFKEEG